MEIGGDRVRRILFGALAFFSLICFVLFIIPVNHQAKTLGVVSRNEVYNNFKIIGKKRHGEPHSPKPVYVSKRRVPNGPDPIHNRRAVKTRQPPDRV